LNRVEVLVIGDELLAGEVADTNGSFLAAAVRDHGLEVTRIVTAGDDPAQLEAAMREAADRAGVVLATGGLGPTEDDRTASVAAAVAGVELQLDEEYLARLKAFFEARGWGFPRSNEKQVWLPAGCQVLPNLQGTAPGFAIDLGHARAFFMPGVPREMKAMFEAQVRPELAELAGGRVVLTRWLDVFGLGESEVADRLADLDPEALGVSIGYRPTFPINHVKVVARGETDDEAAGIADAAIAAIRERLGDRIYGEDLAPIAAPLLDRLRRRGETLATAESCTGGRVGALVTAVAGASEVYLGGVVAYADPVKQALLGVPAEILEIHGAVSAETAEAMALGARERFGASWALSATGIAGPGGGTDDKPVGLVWFGLAGAEGAESWQRKIPGDRHWVQTIAAHALLDRLRRRLAR